MRALIVLLLAPLLHAGPALRVDRPRHAFGEVPPGTPVSTVFVLSNAGDAPVRILKVLPSCECTKAALDARELKPGARALLQVTFEPTKERGPVERSVLLVTDDPATPRLEVAYDADVVLPVMASEEAVFFPDTLRHDRPVRQVTVRATGGRSLRLALRDAPPPFLDVTLAGAGNPAQVRLTLDGARLPREGGVHGVLAFDTGVPEAPEVDLEYFGYAGQAVEARPAGLAFDPGRRGQPQAFTVDLVEVRGRPFRIRRLHPVPPPFRARLLTRGARSRHRLKVSLDPSPRPRACAATVLLDVEDPDQETVAIKVGAGTP